MCRDALLWHARALRDARESMNASADPTTVFGAIEALGRALTGKPKARLAEAKCALLTVLVVTRTPDGGPHTLDHATLIETVRKARNDWAHQGATGRANAARAAELALRLEGALMAKAKPTPILARDVMVSPVTVAEPWQTLYEVRRTMLANGFSALPSWRDDNAEAPWLMLDTGWLATALLDPTCPVTLQTKVADIPARCLPPQAERASPTDPVTSLPGLPVLIIDDGNPVGIVTPADLLPVPG